MNYFKLEKNILKTTKTTLKTQDEFEKSALLRCTIPYKSVDIILIMTVILLGCLGESTQGTLHFVRYKATYTIELVDLTSDW